MTKYNVAAARSAAPPKKEVHAIWQGIGCLLILVVPILSYILATVTVQLAVDRHWPMPYQLMGYPILPALLWRAASGLSPVLAFIQGRNNLYAVLSIAIVYIVILGALISLAYAIIYRLVGPPRYGPLDAPPPDINVKPYKR